MSKDKDDRAQRQQRMEDDVLRAAARLDPADRSTEAEAARETAASIREHRASPREEDRR